MERAYNWKDVKNEVSLWSIEGKGYRSWSPNWVQSTLIRATNQKRAQHCFVLPRVSRLCQSSLLSCIICLLFFLPAHASPPSPSAPLTSRGKTKHVKDRKVRDGQRDKETELLVGVEGMAALFAPTQALPPGTGNPANCSP